jgi:hypothetical protein
LRALHAFRYDAGITVEVFGDRRWLIASADILRVQWEQTR